MEFKMEYRHPRRRGHDPARASVGEAERRDYEAGLAAALDAGAKLLADGGSALDAVEAAVRGARGRSRISTPAAARSSPTTAQIEIDAAIMDGATRNAGAVTGVTATRNPIAARARGDGAQPARLPRRRGRRAVRARAGASSRSTRLVRDRPSAAASSRNCAPGKRRAVRRASQIRHGRRGRAATRRAMSPRPPRPAA